MHIPEHLPNTTVKPCTRTEVAPAALKNWTFWQPNLSSKLSASVNKNSEHEPSQSLKTLQQR